MADKKVSLLDNDGNSINLNKPKILPVDITSFTQITEPGYYRGGMIYNKTNDTIKTDNDGVNYVITDGPTSFGFGQQTTTSFGTAITSKLSSTFKFPSGWFGTNNVANVCIKFDLVVSPNTAYKGNSDTTTAINDGLIYQLSAVGLNWIGKIYNSSTTLKWDPISTSYHVHAYAASDEIGGAARYATHLGSSSNPKMSGSSTKPVYFNENGDPITIDYEINASVPTDAKFTDTVTKVNNTLTSTSTTEALSAAQGKALNEAKAPRPIFSTTDIEIGSNLECGQLYFVMN